MNKLKVLIGDHNPDRIALLKNILRVEFNLGKQEITSVENYDQVISELPKGCWNLVFVADNLPQAERCAPSLLRWNPLLNLAEMYSDHQFFILTSSKPQTQRRGATSRNIHQLFFPIPLLTEVAPQVVAFVKEKAGLNQVTDIREIDWNNEDRDLNAQIRSLSDSRDYEKGKDILQKWINAKWADLPNYGKAEVRSLMEGKSGARVFRVLYHHKDGNKVPDDFVLKLCKGVDNRREKVKREVIGHLEARDTLSNYDVRIPELRYAPIQGENVAEENYIFQSHSWDVICYDFLGGDLGSFISLETVLTGDEDELNDLLGEQSIQNIVEGNNRGVLSNDSLRLHETRKYILRVILDWLCQEWYQHNVLARPAKVEKLWYFSGEVFEPLATAGYSLSNKTREGILGFLRSSKKLGERLMIRDYASVYSKVENFVEGTMEGHEYRKLRQQMTVTTSPVHGDLNANNVLLWVKNCRPFLIDFPFFQKAGHTMQDLARLEVEIKFALMDRQKNSPMDKLKALDHTYSQIPIWEELEEHLRSEQYWQTTKEQESWPSARYCENAQLCLEMVQMIRGKAKIVRKKISGSSDTKGFFDEYCIALLYHTLRAIGYDSLSVFKRLLAVQSAGKLIGCMSQ